jgi:hypothetical protein
MSYLWDGLTHTWRASARSGHFHHVFVQEILPFMSPCQLVCFHLLMKYLSMGKQRKLALFCRSCIAGVPPPRIPTREKGYRIEIMVYQEYFWVSLGPVS